MSWDPCTSLAVCVLSLLATVVIAIDVGRFMTNSLDDEGDA